MAGPSGRTGIDLITTSGNHTREIGARFGRRLRRGDVVLLHGDLGAGKTTLVQGIARGLGINDYVQSPTFTLVNPYAGSDDDGRPLYLYHLDLYRLTDEADLETFGFDDYLEPVDGITVIEWPERAATRLPEHYFLVRLEHLSEAKRRLMIQASPGGGRLDRRLAEFRRELAGTGQAPKRPSTA